MEHRYRVNDTEKKDLYIGVSSHYFKLSDAKEVYRDSFLTEDEDDSILIEIARKNAKEVDISLVFGVEEGERFALALLNLCHSIKY